MAQRFGASGYVVESVPLALFLARRMTAESFADELAALVEAGGDTDTIDSVAGSWPERASACRGSPRTSSPWRRSRK